ncbi:uncharacterized protein DNG_04254 [Cephalotrichum gorgonifer]|uniref:Uncharacterized protein n=1 Tax=Cephalotrichum gorgonifer TaxID=2041049 RepID=A0AAE8MW41_9PEZI|nr:uncharacterized protein DNG_04254 [Cephalotrichum gorgonifer]
MSRDRLDPAAHPFLQNGASDKEMLPPMHKDRLNAFRDPGGSAGMAKFTGFDKNMLPPEYKGAVDTFTRPGGSAEMKLGKLQEVEIT